MHADQAVELADSLDLLLDSVGLTEAGLWLAAPSPDGRTPVDLIRAGQVAEFSSLVGRLGTLPPALFPESR